MELARGILTELSLDALLKSGPEEGQLREWCRLRLKTSQEDFEVALRETGRADFAAILLAALCGEVGHASRGVIADEFIIHRKIFLGQSDFPVPVRGFTSDELEFALQCGNIPALERIMTTGRLIARDFWQPNLLQKYPACQEWLGKMLEKIAPMCLRGLRNYLQSPIGPAGPVGAVGVTGPTGPTGAFGTTPEVLPCWRFSRKYYRTQSWGAAAPVSPDHSSIIIGYQEMLDYEGEMSPSLLEHDLTLFVLMARGQALCCLRKPEVLSRLLT